MQHENRVLKSIDLLTYNARETLSKYSIWATTKDTDVTFNLYDALPSYDDNGSTGSAIFQKPIKIPSFSSISSGIFGTIGSTSNRDIYWNFNFLANGTGWVFDEYVKSNNGQPIKNAVSPVLDIRTDVSFGKTGSAKSIFFNNNDIKYYSINSNFSINDGQFVIQTPEFSVSGKDGLGGVFSVDSKIISIGTNLARIGVSNVSENISDELYLSAKKIAIKSTFGPANSPINLLGASAGEILFGDLLANSEMKSNKLSIRYNQTSSINISSSDSAGVSKIDLLRAVSSGVNKIDVNLFTGLDDNYVRDILIGGNSTVDTLLSRISTISSEGFQLFVKSKYSTINKNSALEYFDCWVDAGVDQNAAIRETAQYSSLVSGLLDPVVNKTSSNPYYLNIGTKGALSILGNESVKIFSNNEISIGINSSPEIIIKPGSVTIPNLSIPSHNAVSISTLRKSSYLRFNPQVKILPFSKLTMQVGGSDASGLEVSVDVSNDYSIVESNKTYIWTTFSYIGSTYYYHSFYLANDSQTTNYKLICDTYSGTATGPNYLTLPTKTVVISGIPKLDKSGIKFDYRRISVAASKKSIYVVYVNKEVGSDSPADVLKVYVSNDIGVSFSKISSESTLPNSFNKMNLHAHSEDDSICACGVKDKLWIATELEGKNNTYIPLILCYNETINNIVSTILPNVFTLSETTSIAVPGNILGNTYFVNNSEVSLSTYKTIPYTSAYNAYQYENASHIKITSVYNSTTLTYDAYVTVSICDEKGSNHNIKLYKLTLTDISLVLIGIANTPVSSNTVDMYYPNELIIRESSTNNYTLHAVYSKYRTVRYVKPGYINNGVVGSSSRYNIYYESGGYTQGQHLGEYGPDYLLNWSESTAFSSSTVITSSGTLGNVNSSIDYRYRISQAKGWSGASAYKIRSLFYISNLQNYIAYMYSSTSTSEALLKETTPLVAISNTSNGVDYTTGFMLPFGDRDMLIENTNSIEIRYDSSSNPTIDYRTMLINTQVIGKTVNYLDQYSKYFTSSFIDSFGASAYSTDIFSSVFSNIKNGKYAYSIGNVNTSSIPGSSAVYSNTNNGEVSQLVLQDKDTSSANYFKTISLNDNTTTTIDGVNISIKKEGKILDKANTKIPVSIFSKCNISDENEQSSSMSRTGVLSKISINSDKGILIGDFGDVGYISNSSKNSMYVPVEIVSIFAKRMNQNILTNLVRSDFTITTISDIAPFNISSNDSSLKFAKVQWKSDVNSGHDLPWIFDQHLSMNNITNEEIHENSKIAYLAKAGSNQVVPYNTSFIRDFIFVYDTTYNRTHVLGYANDNDIKVTFNGDSIFVKGSVVIVSFDNSSINPFDVEFDSSMSLINGSGNVVSIRVDSQNTARIKTVSRVNYSNLILGFTETNHVESSC